MDITVTGELAGLSAAEFDGLDRSAGVIASHERMRNRETDGRWRVRYLLARCGGTLQAAVPLYACRSPQWPDPAYDPRGWELPGDAARDCEPGRYLVLEGYENRRSGFHVHQFADEPARVRTVLAALARVAAQEDRGLIFPYLPATAQTALAQAEPRIAWRQLTYDANLVGVSEPDWEERQDRRVRYNLRHDRQLIAAAGLDVQVRPWAESGEQVNDLIAHHNLRKGQPDHPEFVRMRNQQWIACPDIDLIAFTLNSPAVQGALTALTWSDELYLYEIGLAGPPGPERRAAYFELVFQQPIQYARARGLHTIRLGTSTERVKTGRGAVLEALFGGVLTVADTQRLAREQPC